MLLALCSQAVFAQEWEPIADPYDQVFPSYEIATANMPNDPSDDPTVLGEGSSLLGARIVAGRNGQKVSVTVSMPGLLEPSRFQGTLARAGTTYEVYPLLRWNFSALKSVRQSRPETLDIRVSFDGGPEESKSVRVRLRSVNEALYYVDVDEEVEGDELDFNWTFAAYVNEDSPLVDTILKEALQTGIVDSFDGQQSEDASQVIMQVFAVWHALKRRGIRYSSITATASTHQMVYSQNVRFIEQSWRNNQANCVDGSVMFASVLRKIDIEPVLVLVPGHMFMGFALDSEGENWAYLETTMLGSEEADEVDPELVEVADGFDDPELRDSFLVFASALANAEQQVAEGAENFEDESNPEYQMIQVSTAREAGVMPIASE
jgi:hypothetical protein